MNGKVLAILAVGCLVLLPSLASADVDLSISDVNVVWVGGGYFRIEAEITYSANAYHDGIVTDVTFEVDGSVVGSVTVDFAAFDPSGVDPRCTEDTPPCEGLCPPLYYNGQWYTTYMCSDWFSQPNCSCIYLIYSPPSDPVQYNGENDACATIDQSDQVAESDETNNTMCAQIGQEPNIDFEPTSCDVSWDGNEFTIEVEIQASVHGDHAGFYTDVGFYFDGSYHSSVVFDAQAFGPNPSIKCEDTYPDCDGLCQPTIINGQVVNGSCSSWFVGGDKCACIYLVAKSPGPIQHTSQNTCEIYVDESNGVAEADETNNTLYCEIGPSAFEPMSWSTIKALYR